MMTAQQTTSTFLAEMDIICTDLEKKLQKQARRLPQCVSSGSKNIRQKRRAPPPPGGSANSTVLGRKTSEAPALTVPLRRPPPRPPDPEGRQALRREQTLKVIGS